MTNFEKFCVLKGVKINAVQGSSGPTPEQFRGMYPWSIRLTYKDRRLTIPYFTVNDVEPTSGEVLYCLIGDAQSYDSNPTLPEFCVALGFHSNITYAAKVFYTCQSMSGKIKRFLGDEFGTFAYKTNER